MKRILLTEDHAAFRKALVFMLEREPGLEVTAQAGPMAEVRASGNGGFDVAVVDLMLPGGDGTEAIREPREANPGLGILTLSADRDPGRALEVGADETPGKDASSKSIVAAVRRLADA